MNYSNLSVSILSYLSKHVSSKRMTFSSISKITLLVPSIFVKLIAKSITCYIFSEIAALSSTL